MKKRIVKNTQIEKVVEYTTNSKWRTLQLVNEQGNYFNIVDNNDINLVVKKKTRFEKVIPIENGIGAVFIIRGWEYKGAWIIVNEDQVCICDCGTSKPKRIKDIYNNKLLITDQVNRLYTIYDCNGFVISFKSLVELHEYLKTLSWPEKAQDLSTN